MNIKKELLYWSFLPIGFLLMCITLTLSNDAVPYTIYFWISFAMIITSVIMMMGCITYNLHRILKPILERKLDKLFDIIDKKLGGKKK